MLSSLEIQKETKKMERHIQATKEISDRISAEFQIQKNKTRKKIKPSEHILIARGILDQSKRNGWNYIYKNYSDHAINTAGMLLYNKIKN